MSDPYWNPDLYTQDGTFLARPDAHWPQAALALEIDSAARHFPRRHYEATLARHLRMEQHGLHVLPVTPTTLRDRPQEMADTLRQPVAERTGHNPAPSIKLHGYVVPWGTLVRGNSN